MKKKDFLALAQREIQAYMNWNEVLCDNGIVYIGCAIEDKVFLYLYISVRPDNYKVGLGVGWAPSKEAKVALIKLKENPPIKYRDGSLAKLKTLDNPRDFQYENLHLPIFALYKPFGGFNLETESVDAIIASMFEEIDQYALPYLSLMLEKRFGLNIQPQDLKL